MLSFLRNNQWMYVVFYVCLFAELAVPHSHQIGQSAHPPVPHCEKVCHVEETQPCTVFHALDQLYKTYSIVSFIPAETRQFSFDGFTEYTPLYGRAVSRAVVAVHLTLQQLRAPPLL